MTKLTYKDYEGFLKSIDIHPIAFYDYDNKNDCLVEQKLENIPSNSFICFSVDKLASICSSGAWSTIKSENDQPIYCLDVFGLECNMCSLSSTTLPHFIKNISGLYSKYLAFNHTDHFKKLRTSSFESKIEGLRYELEHLRNLPYSPEIVARLKHCKDNINQFQKAIDRVNSFDPHIASSNVEQSPREL